MASSTLPAAKSSLARCASFAGSGDWAMTTQVRSATTMRTRRILQRRHPEEDARAGSEPVHLAAEGLFVSGVRGHPNQFAPFLFELDFELKRILQVLIDQQEVGPALDVLKLTGQKTARGRRSHVALGHFHRGDQLALAKGMRLFRHVRIMVD